MMAPRAVISVARAVSKTLTQHGIPHAVTGGLAVSFHGFASWTTIVEFVVPRSARSSVAQLGRPASVSKLSQDVVVTVDGVEVALWLLKKPLSGADLSLPTHRGRLPILTLDALVASKATTGDAKDIIEVVELLKLGTVSTDEVGRRLSPAARRRFQDLVTIADLEAQGKPKKGRRILIRMLAGLPPPR